MNKEQFTRSYYTYQGNHLRHSIICARYCNAAGFALAVVALVQFDNDGNMRDWAAYWHGCDKTAREEDAVRWVAEHGCKLSDRDAAHFFPSLPMECYRG